MQSTGKVLNLLRGVSAQGSLTGMGLEAATHSPAAYAAVQHGWRRAGRLLAQLTDLGDLQGDNMSDITNVGPRALAALERPPKPVGVPAYPQSNLGIKSQQRCPP